MVSVTTKLRAGITILANRDNPLHGAISGTCASLGISRSSAYASAKRLEEVLGGRLQASLRGQLQELRAQVLRLKEENAFQAQYVEFLEGGPSDEVLEAFVLESAVAPVSLRTIPVLLKRAFGVDRSHAWVKEIIDRYAVRARAIFQKIAPYRLSREAAVDEIFLGRTPLLTAVDLDSLALLAGRKAEHRDAATWKALLAEMPQLQLAISDKARGIKAALGELKIPSGDDLFHFKRLLHKALRRMEAQCYQRIDQEYALEKDLKRRRSRGQDTRGTATHYAHVKKKVWEALGRFDAAERLLKKVEQALEIFDSQGNVPTWGERQQIIQDALQQVGPLGVPHVRQIQSYVRGWGLLKFAHILDQKLAMIRERAADAQLYRDALRWVGLAGDAGARGDSCRALTEALGYLARWPDNPMFWATVARVRQAIGEVRRASSAVETVNSILRVYQMVKKDFSEDFFFLVALHYNMRPFQEGGRKGKTPFELLGVTLPTGDWIELLRTF